MKKILFSLLIILIVASCSSRKKIYEEKPISKHKPVKDTRVFFSNITSLPSFNSVKINSKIEVHNGKFIPTLNATFYIEKDKKIWANISAFMGLFGGARALVTPEGIRAYEKINKTYIDSDFTYLNQLLGVNFINFQALQELLIGKTFVPVNDNDFSLTQNMQGFTLTSDRPQRVNFEGKTYTYHISLNYNKDYQLTSVHLKAPATQHQLDIFYKGWEQVGKDLFPKNVKIIIKTDKTEEILIENTNFALLQMDTPYSVPANYKKKAIR